MDQFMGEMKKKFQYVVENTKRQRVRNWSLFTMKVNNSALILIPLTFFFSVAFWGKFTVTESIDDSHCAYNILQFTTTQEH